MTTSRQRLTEYYGANKQYTIAEVLNSPFGSLSKIVREHGEQICRALLVKLVIDVTKFFNYNRTINEQQCTQTVSLALECFPDYTIEDFIRCFKNMKMGKYGKFYEGMDGNKILECLEQYGVDKANEIYEFRRKESNEYKLASNEIGEALLPVLKKVVEKLDAKEKIKAPSVPKVRERTENEKRFDKWIEQFETIYSQRPIKPGGSKAIKFIKRYGKIMDINTFLNYKLEQFNNYKPTKQHL